MVNFFYHILKFQYNLILLLLANSRFTNSMTGKGKTRRVKKNHRKTIKHGRLPVSYHIEKDFCVRACATSGECEQEKESTCWVTFQKETVLLRKSRVIFESKCPTMK